ncbi:4356_t:CDS:2 [Funneliformis geosporum]|uniref:7444_t:CDS:1 n=1 Tax=Funneliformis geosporum TaxID=1117311 RepID=A0A9W4WHV0_9GLOM|nr:7444_t:CDS:2 [Funneliformis geosporum]CAI2164010.1 4356_t:CDS:2 [Funneliformis geosporum]
MEVESATTTLTMDSANISQDDDLLLSLKPSMDLPPPPVNRLKGGSELERRESTDSNFSLRPSYKQKFKAPVAKQIIQNILHQRLNDALYDKDQAPGWAREISQEIKQKLLELDLNQYKYIVNVTIMENRSAGTRIQCSCAWDRDTDSVAHETFKNDTIVCTIMAFGVYFY